MLRAAPIQRAAIGANVLCGLVSGIGALVVLGWFLDIPALKSVYPGWVTVKFATASFFVPGGVDTR